MALSPERPSWLGLGDCGFEASSDPTALHLPGFFHAPQQQEQLLNSNFFYNAQQFPAVSWSTTDPTILLTDHHQQQQQQHQRDSDVIYEMGSGDGNGWRVSCDSTVADDGIGVDAGSFCELSSFPNADHQQQLQLQRHSCSDVNDLHHIAAAGIHSSSTTATLAAPMVAAENLNPHVGLDVGGRSAIRSPDTMSSTNINNFSFCGGGSVNASTHSMCSLSSDQYYSCSADALLLPKLVSDIFSDSPQQLSALGPFKTHQHRPYTMDSLDHIQRPLPLSLQWPSEQIHGSSSSGTTRYKSDLYPGVMSSLTSPILGVNSSTTTGNSASTFYRDSDSFSNLRLPHQQEGLAAVTSSYRMAAGGTGSGLSEFSGRFESRRDYSSDLTLFSASRKPTVNSIEPQSVAARHRRKKISERVRILEKLIPGGNKMDTASMLDEATEYVKFLQLQVQLLESMGEPEAPNVSSSTAGSSAIGHSNNSSCGQFYPNGSNKRKIDSSAGRFGSSSHVSRSASLMQQCTVAAAAAACASTAAKATSTPPLILSELLQEQLFKRRLCLVSLSQYCPQQQVTR